MISRTLCRSKPLLWVRSALSLIHIYVGVSGDGQFTAYSGHHIAVLDLNSWSVAYTLSLIHIWWYRD